ncbi:MAG: hypothetical protein HOP28_02690 [Gemmatimonadales bacterium]|nr:hypothetical protein [Gemmatimonadales bacterium]
MLVLLVLCLPFGLWWWLRCGPATTLLVVRHADRPATGADDLTPAGVARAQELVHLAEKAGVTAVYRTNTVRSEKTAAPLAAALGLTPVIYPQADVAGVVAQVFADHRGETVVVVGHSDTAPLIVAEAGGPTLAEIAGTEFDNLFVLTVCRCWRSRATLVNLQYGAVSP